MVERIGVRDPGAYIILYLAMAGMRAEFRDILESYVTEHGVPANTGRDRLRKAMRDLEEAGLIRVSVARRGAVWTYVIEASERLARILGWGRGG